MASHPVLTTHGGHMSAHKLDVFAWSFFFIWIGIALLSSLGWGIGLLGVGIIILGKQATRKYMALGFETFDVPSGDKIAQVQYSLNGGLYGNSGEWQIGNGQALPSAAPPSTGPVAPPTAQTPAAPPRATTSVNGAQAVVERYFAAINAGNYAIAWLLGGMNISQGSYDSFVQGFAGTSSDTVTIVSVSGDTVTVQLDAAQTDGTHKYFAGTYTVKEGVIVAADIH